MKFLRALPVWAIVGTVVVYSTTRTRADEAVKTPKLLQSFEGDTDIKDASLNHASAQLVEQGATNGKKALQITFQPPAMYPSYSFNIPQPWDWTGYGGIALDVTNPGAEPASFALRIDSARMSDGKNNSRTGAGKVEPGKTVSFLMPFNVEPLSPDMSKLPGLTSMMDYTGGWSPFNLANIVMVQIFSTKPPADRKLIFDNLRLIPALPSVPAPPLKTENKSLLSFENAAEVAAVRTNSSSVTATDKAATQGKTALHMKFEPQSMYPNVAFSLDPPGDFRGYGGLAFDLTNVGKDSASFGVRVDSSDKADGNGNNSRTGTGSLEAGEKGTFVLPFGIPPSALGMKGLPGFGDYRSLGSSGAGPFDLGHIVLWQIFLVRPGSSRELVLDNVRLVPGQKQDFNKIVDRYGQYTRAEWPGKIKQDADFAAQLKTEDADLKVHDPLADRDQYGGWAKGPQLKATGFFRTEKYNGKWSFVDPEGRLFLSFGPTTVGPNASTITNGREYMFEALPAADPILAKYVKDEKGGTVDFLAANLERKYGADYKKVWFERTYDRLRSWGFNTIGAFSSWDTLKNSKVPYTATVWPSGGHAHVGLMDDPFDPKFAASVHYGISGMAQRIKDDPYCIGYFVSNEQPWGFYRNGPRSRYSLIFSVLKSKTTESPAKQAFLAQLREKYGDVAKLNAAWGTSYANWETMNESLTFKDPLSDGLAGDFSALLKSFASKYFQTVRDVVKKDDPNHLYLGCRFAGYSPEILDAAAEFTDVMSFNIYATGIDPSSWTILDPYDHPVLVGEFHFGATDRGVFDSGLIAVADQAARGRAYRDYLYSVLDHPKFVGAHWFQYTDEPTTGRSLDGENGNIGFVSIADTPYPELIAGARQVHAEMYQRRFVR